MSIRARLAVALLGVLFLLTRPSSVAGQSAQEMLKEGREALQAKDFKRAENAFAVLIKQDPSATNYAYLAVAELSAGEPTRAITNFKQARQLGNDSANLHFYWGMAYLQNKDASSAIRELRAALSKDPKLFQADAPLGVALVNDGRPKEAVPYLELARTHSAADAEIHASLVRAEFEAGDTSKALASIDAAVDAIPENSRLDATLAFLCLHHRQAQKARQLLESASELNPQDVTLKLLLADASVKAGEPVEALAVLKGVPEDAGAPGELAFLRGNAYLLSGDSQRAAPYLTAATAADPKNVNYHFAYATLQGSEQKFPDALATLTKARELDPQTESIPYQMAVALALMRRFPEALQSCEEALRLAHEADEVYFLRGVIEIEQGNLHVAEQSLRRAVALNSGVASYHAALGVALLETENLTESGRELDQALSMDAQAAPAYLWRARLLAKQGQPTKALADYESYTALAPDTAKAYQEEEALYRQAGEAEKAAAAHTKYVALRAEKSEADRDPSFLDQLWLGRLREGLGQVGLGQ
ncbi:MAG: tetratricopeptide repeat protein [Terriglobia bacterium]